MAVPSTKINGDVKEDNGPDRYDIETGGFGGYAGAQFRVNENAGLNTEFQWATYFVGFAANLIWQLQ